jgi:DNA-binding HxlR family transcriptional regulator
VGDRWTLLILRDAFAGTCRFEAFRDRLGIARNILSGRLRTLVREGIFERRQYQTPPDRYEYKLTSKGTDLFSVVLALRRWGKRWLTGEDGDQLRIVHVACGQEVEPTLTCSHCNRPIEEGDAASVLALDATESAAAS